MRSIIENLEMWNCLLEKIWGWLKISIKYSYKFVIFDIITVHCRFEIPSFVACSKETMSIDNVDSLLAPLRDLRLDQPLDALVIRVIQNLNQQTLFWPVELTHCRYRELVYLLKKETMQELH